MVNEDDRQKLFLHWLAHRGNGARIKIGYDTFEFKTGKFICVEKGNSCAVDECELSHVLPHVRIGNVDLITDKTPDYLSKLEPIPPNVQITMKGFSDE